MQPDDGGDPAAPLDLLGLHLVGPAAADVLAQVVAVGGGETGEEPAGHPAVAPEAPRPLPGDLEIDEVRPCVVADNDVLAFFEVDVGDAAGVQGLQQSSQAREELVVDLFVALEVVAGDELVGEGQRAELAEQARHAGHVLRLAVETHLPGDQPLADPVGRQAEEVR